MVGDPIKCLAGRYGIEGMTNPQCTGGCEAGYYCEAGTTDMQPCGSSDVYCPALSVAPVPVASGYYTTPEDGDETLRTGQALCPIGSFSFNVNVLYFTAVM